MNWSLAIRVVLVGLIVAFIAWIATHTYWAEVTMPMPLKGEAARNPFYAAQRFAEALGARTEWNRAFVKPPGNAVLVVSYWHWGLSKGRRTAVERWVESGGRLVVDRSLIQGDDRFEQWSGIARQYPLRDDDDDEEADRESELPVRGTPKPCRTLDEEGSETLPGDAPVRHVTVCGFAGWSWLTSSRTAVWALRDESGMQVVRVTVGRGSVTVINAVPFRFRDLFDDENGILLVAATQLRAGDQIHFLSEGDPESLLGLAWRSGAPVVVILSVLLALALWRAGARFGPRIAASDSARRSLAEQIRGTGQFVMRFGGGKSLHAAAVRALNEAAARRISAYDRLSAGDRMAALAQASRLDASDLAAAIHHSGPRRSNELRSAIALIEAARRQVLIEKKGSKHGN